MDEVRLRGRGDCVEHISREMRLGVDSLRRMLKGRNCCWKFERCSMQIRIRFEQVKTGRYLCSSPAVSLNPDDDIVCE